MFKILNGRMQTSEIFTSVEVQLNSGLLITIPAKGNFILSDDNLHANCLHSTKPHVQNVSVKKN